MAIAFDPTDWRFNRRNALYLAHAADIAYHRSPGPAAMERLGLRAIAFRHKITRTRGFLGLCDTHAVLAFRGSDPVTLPNWVTDAVVRLVERPEYQGRVHQGFSSVLKRSWGPILGILEDAGDKPLFLTGHSMGGALAVLAACRLAKLGRPPVAIYTFGSPRIGDRSFCAGYALPTYRIVNRLDLVPELPLASLKRLLPGQPALANQKVMGKLKRLMAHIPCYGHVKTFVYIDRDGEVIPEAEVEPWHAHAVARAILTRGKSFLEGITDHLISHYIRGLEKMEADGQGGSGRQIQVRRRRKSAETASK